MSKLVFKPEMFEEVYAATSIHELKRDMDKYKSSEIAQKAFDEWLEKQPAVFGFGAYDGWGWRTDSRNGETQKAYVVCIEPIRECEHKRIETRYPLERGGLNYTIEKFYCLDCNKELKPKNGWEEIKD